MYVQLSRRAMLQAAATSRISRCFDAGQVGVYRLCACNGALVQISL